MTLWNDASASKQKLHDLAEKYAAFQQQKKMKVEL
jgi:hypothetical protein